MRVDSEGEGECEGVWKGEGDGRSDHDGKMRASEVEKDEERPAHGAWLQR